MNSKHKKVCNGRRSSNREIVQFLHRCSPNKRKEIIKKIKQQLYHAGAPDLLKSYLQLIQYPQVLVDKLSYQDHLSNDVQIYKNRRTHIVHNIDESSKNTSINEIVHVTNNRKEVYDINHISGLENNDSVINVQITNRFNVINCECTQISSSETSANYNGSKFSKKCDTGNIKNNFSIDEVSSPTLEVRFFDRTSDLNQISIPVSIDINRINSKLFEKRIGSSNKYIQRECEYDLNVNVTRNFTNDDNNKNFKYKNIRFLKKEWKSELKVHKKKLRKKFKLLFGVPTACEKIEDDCFILHRFIEKQRKNKKYFDIIQNFEVKRIYELNQNMNSLPNDNSDANLNESKKVNEIDNVQDDFVDSSRYLLERSNNSLVLKISKCSVNEESVANNMTDVKITKASQSPEITMSADVQDLHQNMKQDASLNSIKSTASGEAPNIVNNSASSTVISTIPITSDDDIALGLLSLNGSKTSDPSHPVVSNCNLNTNEVEMDMKIVNNSESTCNKDANLSMNEKLKIDEKFFGESGDSAKSVLNLQDSLLANLNQVNSLVSEEKISNVELITEQVETLSNNTDFVLPESLSQTETILNPPKENTILRKLEDQSIDAESVIIEDNTMQTNDKIQNELNETSADHTAQQTRNELNNMQENEKSVGSSKETPAVTSQSCSTPKLRVLSCAEVNATFFETTQSSQSDSTLAENQTIVGNLSQSTMNTEKSNDRRTVENAGDISLPNVESDNSSIFQNQPANLASISPTINTNNLGTSSSSEQSLNFLRNKTNDEFSLKYIYDNLSTIRRCGILMISLQCTLEIRLSFCKMIHYLARKLLSESLTLLKNLVSLETWYDILVNNFNQQLSPSEVPINKSEIKYYYELGQKTWDGRTIEAITNDLQLVFVEIRVLYIEMGIIKRQSVVQSLNQNPHQVNYQHTSQSSVSSPSQQSQLLSQSNQQEYADNFVHQQLLLQCYQHLLTQYSNSEQTVDNYEFRHLISNQIQSINNAITRANSSQLMISSLSSITSNSESRIPLLQPIMNLSQQESNVSRQYPIITPPQTPECYSIPPQLRFYYPPTANYPMHAMWNPQYMSGPNYDSTNNYPHLMNNLVPTGLNLNYLQPRQVMNVHPRSAFQPVVGNEPHTPVIQNQLRISIPSSNNEFASSVYNRANSTNQNKSSKSNNVDSSTRKKTNAAQPAKKPKKPYTKKKASSTTVSATSVSTPSVSTPTVSTPSVSTPSVSTPSVSTAPSSTSSMSTPLRSNSFMSTSSMITSPMITSSMSTISTSILSTGILSTSTSSMSTPSTSTPSMSISSTNTPSMSIPSTSTSSMNIESFSPNPNILRAGMVNAALNESCNLSTRPFTDDQMHQLLQQIKFHISNFSPENSQEPLNPTNLHLHKKGMNKLTSFYFSKLMSAINLPTSRTNNSVMKRKNTILSSSLRCKKIKMTDDNTVHSTTHSLEVDDESSGRLVTNNNLRMTIHHSQNSNVSNENGSQNLHLSNDNDVSTTDATQNLDSANNNTVRTEQNDNVANGISNEEIDRPREEDNESVRSDTSSELAAWNKIAEEEDRKAATGYACADLSDDNSTDNSDVMDTNEENESASNVNRNRSTEDISDFPQGIINGAGSSQMFYPGSNQSIANTQDLTNTRDPLEILDRFSIPITSYERLQQIASVPIESHRCLRCRNQSVLACQNCLKAFYCTKRCQELHWKANHHRHCQLDSSNQVD